MNDTYVNLDKLSFKIDQDVFSAKASVKNVATNALVDAALKGTINLGNFTKAYPVKLDQPLSGILKADVETKFDMQSVEKSQYENIKNYTHSISGIVDVGKCIRSKFSKSRYIGCNRHPRCSGYPNYVIGISVKSITR